MTNRQAPSIVGFVTDLPRAIYGLPAPFEGHREVWRPCTG